MIAKAGLGLIGLGAIGIGGVAFAKPEWLGINKEIPWTPLSQDKDFNAGSGPYTDTTFGGKHKNYLTGIKEKEEGSNNSWWQKSYEQWKKDHGDNTTRTNLGNKFNSNIVGPVKPKDANEGTDQYLKDICGAIYKATNSNIKATPEASNTNEYKEVDVWKYCSPLGQKPTTIKEFDHKSGTVEVYKANGGTNPIGKDAEDDLISVNDKNNNKFWDIRNREFHGKDPFTTKATFSESADEFFKQGQKDEKHIRDLCKEAYTKKSASASSTKEPTQTETKKFCSFESITTA